MPFFLFFIHHYFRFAKIVEFYLHNFLLRPRAVGEAPKISYGNQFKTRAVYLSTIGHVAIKRLSDFFGEMTYGLANVSKATIAKFLSTTAEKMDIEILIQDLLNGEVIHVDDTTVKTTERVNAEGGLEVAQETTFRSYIRTYSNKRTTILTAHSRKNQESVEADNILTKFQGILSHDHEAKFYHFGDKHATCDAHLSRELKGMDELYPVKWASEFRRFFVGMNTYKNEDMKRGLHICDPPVLDEFECQYDCLVEKGIEQLGEMNAKDFGYGELPVLQIAW